MLWWELAEVGKKLFLIGFMALILPGSFLQVGIGLAFTLIFMLLTSVAMPYRARENDYFAMACNFALASVFFFCCCLRVAVLKDSVEVHLSADLVADFDFDVGLVGVALLSSIVAAMVLTFTLGAQSIFAAASVPTLRLLATGNRPEMPLAHHHRWHLFLSHIWSTAQDQCATIKRQLCLLLPGVKIFLDVDDLASIGDLELYIEESSCVMVFVSKGYFSSKNCLREACCAIERRKPLSLIEDPAKGGAPLATIVKEECPKEIRRYLFEAGRPVNQWHRIKDFQVVSLKLLAQDLLAACPGYISAEPAWDPSAGAFSAELQGGLERRSTASSSADGETPSRRPFASLPLSARASAVRDSRFNAPAAAAPPKPKREDSCIAAAEAMAAMHARGSLSSSVEQAEDDLDDANSYLMAPTLALPGELTRRRLRFAAPVTIYCSRYNPGAKEMLIDLQEGLLPSPGLALIPDPNAI